jgi:hypothetical protein
MTAEVPVKITLIGKEAVKSGLSEIAKYAAEAFAVVKLVEFAKTGVEEFAKLQEASAGLSEELGTQADDLVKLGQASAKTSKFRADEIVQGERLLGMYTKSKDNIKALTPVMLNLAAVTGSTETAAKMLGSSFEKGSPVLQRYGIFVHGTAGSQERLNSIISQTNAALGDQNAAMFAAMSPIEKMDKVFNQLAEAVGEQLVPELDNLLTNLPDLTDGVVKATKIILSTGHLAIAGFETIILGIELLFNKTLSVLDKIPGPWQKSLKSAEDATHDAMGAIVKDMNKNFEQVSKIWDDEGAAERKKLGDHLKRVKQATEEEEKARKEAEREVDAQRKKELTDVNEILVKATKEARDINLSKEEAEIADLTDTYEQELNLLEKYHKDTTALTEAYSGKVQKLTEEENDRLAKEKQKGDDRLIKLEEFYNKVSRTELEKTTAGRLKILEDDQKKELNDAKKLGANVSLLEKQQAEVRIEFAKHERDMKIQFGLDYASSTIGMLSNIADAFKANSILKKRLAEGEAIVQGGKGVLGVIENTGSYIGAFGPVAGPIAEGVEIGLIVANTAAEISKIESAKMAYGGIVRGGTAGIDSVPTMLMPGEIVYNPAMPNPALASAMGGNTSTSNTNIHLGDTHITIQGNASSQTVSDIKGAIQSENQRKRQMMADLKEFQTNGKIKVNAAGNLVIQNA